MNSNYKKIPVALAVSLAIGLSGCGEKSSEEYISQGKQSISTSDISGAIIQFKNAVRLSPKDATARMYLGNAYLQQGNYVSAEKELNRAIELGESTNELVLNLAHARAKLVDRDGLKLLLEQSSTLSEHEYAGLLFYAGVAALNEQDLSASEDLFGQASNIDTGKRYGQLAQAYLSFSNKDYDKSQNALAQLLNANDNDKEAILLSGHVNFATGNYERASQLFSQHLALAPSDYAITFFQVNSLLRANQYDEAEQKIDSLMKRYKDSFLAHQYKSQIEYHDKNYREAINHADIAIKSGLRFDIARMVAGVSAYQLKEYESAYDYLKPIEKTIPLDNPIQKVLAVVKLKLGYTEQSVDNFESLEGLTESDVGMLQASSAAMINAQDFNSAQAMIEKAQSISPDNPILSAQKGMILLSKKDVSGLEALEHALKLDPSLDDVELALALQYIQFDQTDKAELIATQWLSSPDKKVSGQLLWGIINTKKHDNDAAVKNFEEVLSEEPNNLSALYNLAIINLYNGKPNDAKPLLEKVIAILPSHKGAIRRYTEIQKHEDKIPDSIAFFEQILNDNKSDISIILGLAQNYRLGNQVDKAIVLLEGVDSTNKNSTYWSILGDSYIQKGDLKAAKKTFINGLASFPKHYLLNLRYAGILERLKENKSALNQIKKMHESYGADTRVNVLLTYYYFLNKDLLNARKTLRVNRNNGVEHVLLDLVESGILLKDKDYDEATSMLSELYEKTPNDVVAVELARALVYTGKKKEAENLLESQLVSSPENNKLRFLLAQLYSNNERTKKIKQYEKLKQSSPKNIIVLNNLAWNYYKLNNNEQALINIEAAYQLNNKDIAILSSYGVILYSEDRKDEAIKMLESAVSKGSNDIEGNIILAEYYAEHGKQREALRIINKVKTSNSAMIKRINAVKAKAG